MAEINIHPANFGNERVRSKKLSTKVDLTPMVDLGFLLITFFILTTTLSQPTVMPVNMPAKGDSMMIARNAVLTLIAAANNQVFYFEGSLDDAEKKSSFGTSGYSIHEGIGQVIAQKQAAMDRLYRGGRKEMNVLIKAAPDASFENIVGLLDEMAIYQVKKYSMIELTDAEKRLLKAKKLIN
jgi:biopolymer transport protein ExbD